VQTLFEFTSLQEAKSVAGVASEDDDSDAGASPLSLARFGQMSDWSKEISIQNAPQPPSQNKLRQTLAAMPSNVLEGNLSALEDAATLARARPRRWWLVQMFRLRLLDKPRATTELSFWARLR
jgi:hypothetical protein